jgi:hypothetical protein
MIWLRHPSHAGGFSQCGVDPVLPTGPALLKMLQNVLIDPHETSSFTPGTAELLGSASGTLVVVLLNAASASLRASFRVLGRLG